MQFTPTLSLPSKDLKLIEDIFNTYPDDSYSHLTHKLRYIYKHEIKPDHFAWLGYLIGERVATERMLSTKSNKLTLCQNHN